MADTLERSLLAGKEREELTAIAGALGIKASPRAKKETVIEQIMKAVSVQSPANTQDKGPDKTASRSKAKTSTPAKAGARAPKGPAEADQLALNIDQAPANEGPSNEGPQRAPRHTQPSQAADTPVQSGNSGNYAADTDNNDDGDREFSQEAEGGGRSSAKSRRTRRGKATARARQNGGSQNGGSGSNPGGQTSGGTYSSSPARNSNSTSFDPFADSDANTSEDQDWDFAAAKPAKPASTVATQSPTPVQTPAELRDPQTSGRTNERFGNKPNDRQGQDRQGQDRQGQDRHGRNRNDRNDRNDRGGARNDRGGERPERADRGNDMGRFDNDLAGNRGRRRRVVRGREPVVSSGQDANIDRVSESYSGELINITGVLDLAEQGYGYIRAKGYLPSPGDIYVPVAKVRQFGLRRGDTVVGEHRPAVGQEKFPAIVNIETVNGHSPEVAKLRPRFEELTPLFPDVKLRLEQPGQPSNMVSRIIDLVSPIGKGQRGLIVSPPKAGKTTIMKQIASSIEGNNPGVHLMVLLIDERPEEVTDMRRHVQGEVVASTFDKPSDEHTTVAELALERAKRLVEEGRDVVIILDGITRLARAYNLAAGPGTGRIMSGGIDTGALYPPKKFFGAARNVEEGGSLTILATALIETGSTMDTVIFEEFKGTGNMELRLDRRLAEKRVYPAINVNESSTRHEELLFDRTELETVWKLRRVLQGLAEDGTAAKSLELLMERIKQTKTNSEFLADIAKAPGQ